MDKSLEDRIRRAWQGRISGCMLGKPVEILSMSRGYDHLTRYLEATGSLPLRDYIPFDGQVELVADFRACCKGEISRSEPDDDIHYSVLALMLLESVGEKLTTADVARAWLNHLPAAATFTAEREAYRALLNGAGDWFASGREPKMDLAECSNNPYNQWIGAQIRADVYGWVCPGNADLAVHLVTQDAALSHRGDGVYGAIMVAAMGALIPVSGSLTEATETAINHIPADSEAAEAVRLGLRLAGDPEGSQQIRDAYASLSPVHTLNNLALVVWALLTWPDDFGAAIGEVVAAGWDTDCNGATVGALWALQNKPIPDMWTAPWQGRVGLNLAGQSEVSLDELVQRTVAVTEKLQVLSAP